jgi:phage terminase small subunit
VLIAKVEKKAGVSREWLLDQFVANYERAMQATPVLDAAGNPLGEFRYHGNVANKALELIGRTLGVFVDRKEVGEPQ